VFTDEFQSLLSEFKDVPEDMRGYFIDRVIINKAELAEGMTIQKLGFRTGNHRF
jgi:hypothetical protein